MHRYRKLLKLAIQNPQLAAYKAKITYKNNIVAKQDFKKNTGTARPPLCVCIKLTNACNLRCKMCGQPREGHKEGDAKYAPLSFFQQKVELQDYAKLIGELASHRPNIYLWGGEPFMYKDIFDLVRTIKDHKMTCQINTNGMYLKKYAREIMDSGIDDLIISIDGPQEVHDEVRGLKGTFHLVKTGIQMIQQMKKERGVKKPIIRVRGTISPWNFEYIHSLIDISKDLGANSLNFNWTWFTTKETGTAHQNLMKHLFDTDAQSWIPYEMDVIMDKEKREKFDGIKQELEKIYNNDSSLPISMSPFLKPDQVDDYYSNIRETFGHKDCFSIYTKSYILPNGDVTPCPDFPDFIAGNILENPFLDVWNGERYRNWRLEIKKRGLFPICYRCCDLFLSDVGFV